MITKNTLWKGIRAGERRTPYSNEVVYADHLKWFEIRIQNPGEYILESTTGRIPFGNRLNRIRMWIDKYINEGLLTGPFYMRAQTLTETGVIENAVYLGFKNSQDALIYKMECRF